MFCNSVEQLDCVFTMWIVVIALAEQLVPVFDTSAVMFLLKCATSCLHDIWLLSMVTTLLHNRFWFYSWILKMDKHQANINTISNC